jgi:hypothetical protein
VHLLRLQLLPWLLELCCTSVKLPFPNGVSQQDAFKDTFDMKLFRSLMREMTQVAARSRTDTLLLFLTERSIGLNSGHYTVGDQVFIEGVDHPFLLRQVRAKEYRIVGNCYIRATSDIYPTYQPELWSQGPYWNWGEPAQNVYVY